MATVSPFKFLDSYTKEDRDIFFGRDQEIDEVYNKVFQDKTLFVYGESGTGKSSLINCGLANKFKKTDWLPVNVRRGENINDSLLAELKKLSLTEVTNLNGSFEKNLFKYTRSIYLDYFKPIYFIFDQFEELYLMGTRNEWKEFISGIKSLADRDLQVHFIFIIRAEYLHFMSEFEEEIPEIFNNKLRIEKITRLKAKDCIDGPCKVFGIKVEPEFTDQLFDQLSPDRNDIELTYLQVFLDRIYKMASEEANGKPLTFSKKLLDNIGMVSDVLSDFLDEQIEALPDKETSLTILKAFVTVDGTKRQASLQDVLSFSKSLGKSISQSEAEESIKHLLERRILKELPDQDKFELRHDALANKIFEKITNRERELIEVRQFLNYGLVEYTKRGFLLNEHDLTYVQPHLDTLDLTPELQLFVDASTKSVGKKRRNRNRIIGIISVIVLLMISSVYGFFDAQKQREEALLQQGLAEQSAKEAESQKLLAQKNEQTAVQSQQLAVESQLLAEENATEASRQTAIAESNRSEAETQRQEAIVQRQNAVVAQQQAEQNAQEALAQKNIADEERQNAERLRMLALAQSLGAKSIQNRDSLVKSFMAAQAFQFNTQYEGDVLENAIFGGLFYATKFLNGDVYNQTLPQVHEVKSLDFFNNQLVSVGSDGKVIVQVMKQFIPESSFESELNGEQASVQGAINSSVVHDNYLIAGTEDGRLILLNLRDSTNTQMQALQNDGFWKIYRDPTSNSLLSISMLGNIHRWDINSITGNNLAPELLYADTTSAKINALQIDGSGNILFNVGADIFSLQSGGTSLTQPLALGISPISTIALSPSSNMLAIGFNDGTLQLFDYQKKTLMASLPGHTSKVADIAFNNTGSLMASGSLDKSLKIWNLNNISKLPTVIDDFDSWVLSIIFSADDKHIITGESNGRTRVISIHPLDYYTQLCAFVDRNMSREEWSQIVGEEFVYSETCPIDNKNE